MARIRSSRTTYRDGWPRGSFGTRDVAADLTVRVIERAAKLSVPWVLAYLVVPLVGWGTHRLWGGPAAAPWAAMGLTVTAVLAAAVAWLSARGKIRRIHTTASVTGALLWVIAAMIVGPRQRPALDLLLWGGGTAALIANLRQLTPRSEDGDAADFAGAWKRLAERVGGQVEGARWRRTIDVTPDRVQGQLALEAGRQTVDDLVRARERLAGAAHVAATGVRVSPDPKRADRATITFLRRDLLAEKTPWPGPSRTGGSIWSAPARYGVYEDGLPAEIQVAGGPDFPSIHLLVLGMSGAGKSMLARALLMDWMARGDVCLWVADPAKGRQTIGPLAAGLDWAAMTIDESRRMLKALDKLISWRTDFLGQLNPPLMSWRPGCGLPYLICWIEEAPDLVADSDRFVELARKARSAGITLVCSLQRATFDQIPVTARKQFGAVICMGVADDTEARFALGDLVPMGADPGAWKTERPGCAYTQAPGIPTEQQLTPLKVYWQTDTDPPAAVAASRRVSLDPAAAEHLGAVYIERHARQATAAITPAGVVDTADGGSGAEDQDDELSRAEELAERELVEMARRLAGEDPEPDLPGRLEDQPDDDTIAEVEFDTAPVEKPSTDAVRAAFRTWIEVRLDRDEDTFAARDLYELFEAAGRSRPTIHRVLNEFMEAGLIARERTGTYRIKTLAAA